MDRRVTMSYVVTSKKCVPVIPSIPKCGGPCGIQTIKPFQSLSPTAVCQWLLMGVHIACSLLLTAAFLDLPLWLQGQIVVVKVIDKLTSEGITIQYPLVWDAPVMLSLAPIVPGAEFNYIVIHCYSSRNSLVPLVLSCWSPENRWTVWSTYC